MRKRLSGVLLALGMGGALVAFTPGAALAATASGTATAPLSATLTAGSIGTRAISSVTPGSFSSVLGNATMSSSLAVAVAEAAVGGDANWYVTGQVSQFADSTTPTPNIIPASALANSGNSTTVVGGGGTVAEGANGALGTSQTFFTDTGELVGTLYTGTYTNASTLTLTPPNGTIATGIADPYTATLTVTLFT
ncbi:MAG TPA: hypothetical protein VNF50_09510 [Acidimicrobiales bacterium]|nr:hypothetical protein [Acidimicrobiales bacterium]